MTFGEPVKAAEDFVVLNTKNLRDLELSTYLKSDAITYIQKWIKLKNSDEFVKKVYFTLRDIHTTIKNYEAPVNNSSIFFQKRTADKVPRFDQILKKANAVTRAQTTQVARK